MTAGSIPPPHVVDLALPDEAATTRLGARLDETLGAGDTVLLEGPIGSGKSHLARALIQSRARRGGDPVPDVPSPTFTLVQSYDLALGEIVHSDLYRLGDPSELAELGLEDAFGTALCLVEWPDRLGSLTPAPATRITLRLQGEGRHATITPGSHAWASRFAAALGEAAPQ